MEKKPFLPSDLPRHHNATLVRAASQTLVGNALGWQTARRLWGDVKAADVVSRAASAPADSSTSGWAGVYSGTRNANVIAGLSPSSASAALLSRGLQFQFNGAGEISVPVLPASASFAGWIAQGAPIPVLQFAIAAAALAPRRLAIIVPFAREVVTYSRPSIEAVVAYVLAQSIGAAVDAAYWMTLPAARRGRPDCSTALPQRPQAQRRQGPRPCARTFQI